MHLWLADTAGIYRLDALVVGAKGKLIGYMGANRIPISPAQGWEQAEILERARASLAAGKGIVDLSSPRRSGTVALTPVSVGRP
jgi:hypothetical protein